MAAAGAFGLRRPFIAKQKKETEMAKQKKDTEQQGTATEQKQQAENQDLVPMQKDGTVLNVHRNGVAEHEKLGWRRVAAED